MIPLSGTSNLQQTTSYKVVLPFYVYASICFLVSSVLLLLNVEIVQQHYFHPHTLAIVHTMALGWGTMMIFGASYQLLPVLIEGKLDSNLLAYISFGFTAIGIPILILGFYLFHTGWMLQLGAIFVNIGVVFYLVNVLSSIYESSKHDIHAWFIGTATIWLFSTTFFGLLLVFNFSKSLFPDNSVAYLSLHAHLGIIGWFLLLIMGVGSRLIPMFLISKYTNTKILWWIFFLINSSLVSFILLFLLNAKSSFYYISLALALLGIGLFAYYIRMAHLVRIRKNVDEQMKISIISVGQMLLPLLILLIILLVLPANKHVQIAMLYGFCIFFGWITAIILGMTFKTLPFIVWNKVYHKKAYSGKTPVPKELFNENVFHNMFLAYLSGFILFISGIIILNTILLRIGAILLLLSAVLYVYNVAIILLHKPKKI
ncbi:MAG: cytochrome C oxidase subunit I [Chitinophagales bacterium]|nr:cytochrome C oxidase subunit I [Chitinophagales bacterium]